MAEHAAVIGIGQTDFDAKRVDVSQVGLIREAAQRALEDAQLSWSDIDAVVIGKAPDMFEGVMMPELFLAEALGCVGKPMLRVHTAGSVGGSTAIVAPFSFNSSMGKNGSSTFVSCRHSRSGWTSFSQSFTCERRVRIELTFQVAISTG